MFFFFFDDKKSNRIQWIEKVRDSVLLNKVTIVQGLRRIGKTLLVETVANDDVFKEYEVKAFDAMEFGLDKVKKAIDFIKEFKENPNKSFLLIVDEFQELEEWNKFFWSLYKIPNVKVVATGSVSANLNLIRETEGGRYVYIYMKPLSFVEYKEIHEEMKLFPNQDDVFNKYATMGSYPEQEFSEKLLAYKKQVTDNIIEKIRSNSLLEKIGISSSHDVTKVLLWTIENIGGMVSVNNMASKLQMNSRTVDKILNYLKQTFIVYEVANSKIGAGKAASYNRKFYLTDHTFYLFIKQNQYKNLDEYQNLLFENIVINQVKSNYEREEAEINFFKDKTFDLDLVIKKDDKLNFFEIKNTDSKTSLSKTQKEFAKDNKLGVIYLGKTEVKDKIQYINYIEFFERMRKWI